MPANAPIKIPRLKLRVNPKAAAANAVVGTVNEWIDDLCNYIERAMKISPEGGIGVTQTPAGTAIKLNLPETFYVQLTGAADSVKGGYAWQEVYERSALYIKNRGTGYTTASISFTGDGTGAAATIAVNPNKTLADPVITNAGTNYTTITATLTGDGTGATIGWQLNEGSLQGMAWVSSGRTGSTGDLAYEIRNARALIPNTGTPYLAMRDQSTGRLLFFSSLLLVAKTKTISAYPTTAGVYYGMEPISVGGLETEGGSGAITASGLTFYALNLGGTIPPNGSKVKCAFNGVRWAFRYD